MRHIVIYDEVISGWAVVDTQSAHMVVSFHRSRNAAKAAAAAEEKRWPSRG